MTIPPSDLPNWIPYALAALALAIIVLAAIFVAKKPKPLPYERELQRRIERDPPSGDAGAPARLRPTDPTLTGRSAVNKMTR